MAAPMSSSVQIVLVGFVSLMLWAGRRTA